MEIKIICPLGCECEKAIDGYVQRCAWYVKLTGKDPQSNKEIDEWGCSMSWMPIMLTEVAQTNRGQTHALESFRNEVIKGNDNLSILLSRNKLINDL